MAPWQARRAVALHEDTQTWPRLPGNRILAFGRSASRQGMRSTKNSNSSQCCRSPTPSCNETGRKHSRSMCVATCCADTAGSVALHAKKAPASQGTWPAKMRGWKEAHDKTPAGPRSAPPPAIQPDPPQPPRRNSDSRTGPSPPPPSGLGAPFAGASPDPLLLLSLSLLSPSFRLRFFRFRSLSLLLFSLVLFLRSALSAFRFLSAFRSALSAFRFLLFPSVTCGRKRQDSLLQNSALTCKAAW
jgi:hypothetical protein